MFGRYVLTVNPLTTADAPKVYAQMMNSCAKIWGPYLDCVMKVWGGCVGRCGYPFTSSSLLPGRTASIDKEADSSGTQQVL